MRHFLFAVVAAVSACASFAAGTVGELMFKPSMNKYEAEAIADAAKAASPADARDVLLRASSKSWASAPVFFNLGNAYYGLGDFKNAVKFYRAALEKSGFFAAYKNLGFALSADGDKPAAARAFAVAAAISGNSDAQCLLWLAGYRADGGDYSSALALCNQALVHEPENDSAIYAKCGFLIKLSMFDSARATAERMFEKTSDARYLKLAAIAAAEAGDRVSAAAYLELLSASGKASERDTETLADLYFSLGAHSKAAELYSRAPSAKLENLAFACINSGEFETAEKIAAKLPPNPAKKVSGIAAARRGCFSAAKKLLAECAKADPADLQTSEELAEVLYRLGEYAESAAVFARLQSAEKFDRRAKYGLLRNSMAMGLYADALSTAREIALKYPDADIENFKRKLEAYCNALEKSAQ